MQKLLLLLALVSGLSMAQESSFEREFSKFDKDFERLNSWKAETPASKKLKRAPATPAPAAAPAVSAEPAVTRWMMQHLQNRQLTQRRLSMTNPPRTPSYRVSHYKVRRLRKKLPKGAKVEKLARNDLLGNQISDPVVRKKVQELYQRPDVVVQQYVLPTN